MRRPRLIDLSRRTLLAAGPALAFAGAAGAQVTGTRILPDTSAEGEGFETPMPLDAWTDAWGRPTAKVTVNGRGPYQFLVDTGSNITVLASRHAAALGAPAIGVAIVNGTTGAAEMPIAMLSKLETGVVARSNLRVAVVPDANLAREDGILGADVFAGRRLTFEIREKIVKVESSRRRGRAAPVSNMRVRNGMLAEIDGRIGTIHTRLMLDTGAQHCIANLVLKAALERTYPRMRRVNRVRILGVTGHSLVGDYFELPKADFKAFSVKDAGAVAADAPIFRLWELEREPAMIVGVNLLSRLSRFTIDYGAREFDAEMFAAAIAQRGRMLG